MPIKRKSGRQHLQHAEVEINYNDIVSGAAERAIDLPAGAILHGGDVVILTPFNSATSDVARVGDVTNNNRYASADINLAAAAGTRTALTLTGYVATTTEPAVTFKWTGVGAAPSAGKVRLSVLYSVQGRVLHGQGLDT